MKTLPRLLSLLLSLALLLGLFACNSAPREDDTPSAAPVDHREELDGDEPVTLTILSERTMWGDNADFVRFNKKSNFNEFLKPIIKWYETEHPNVKIELENPTISEDQRTQAVQQRRVALAAGEAPDIYLQPSISQMEMHRGFEMVFKDPAQSMTNGWFADISGYYNGDEDLRTEELQPAVMEAGVYQGRRYILPLWYSMEVFTVRKDAEKAGEAVERMDEGIQSFFEDRQDVPCWNCFFSSTEWFLNHFPQVCDYEKEEVLLKQEELESYIDRKIQWEEQEGAYLQSLGDSEWVNNNDVVDYINSAGSSGPFSDERMPSFTYRLERLPEVAALAKHQGLEIHMAPVRATDGSLTASVSYWGAVSAGSEHKAWAYDFLRTLLSPEVQHWGTLHGSDGSVVDIGFDPMLSPGPGWPVRYKGFAKAQWQAIVKRHGMTANKDDARKYSLGQVELDDSDLPVLDMEIDRARIPGELDKMAYEQLGRLDYWSGSTPADIEKAVSGFLRDARYQLAEG